MKELVTQLINYFINKKHVTSRQNFLDLPANLTTLSNLIQVRYISYWSHLQSKYMFSLLRFFGLGLLFLILSINNGISGEFFLFLIAFEFLYANILKIFNIFTKNYMNIFTINFNSEALLIKLISNILVDYKKYMFKFLNQQKALKERRRLNIKLFKKSLLKSLKAYILFTSKYLKNITLVKGNINFININNEQTLNILQKKAYNIVKNYLIENEFKSADFKKTFISKLNLIKNKEGLLSYKINNIKNSLNLISNVEANIIHNIQNEEGVERATSSNFANKIAVEWGWIILPSIAIGEIVSGSSELLYFEDKPNVKTNITVTGWAKANQWYWAYQYINVGRYISTEVVQRAYDSYLVAAELIEGGAPRLLISLNEYILPAIFNIKLLLTSIDVIHSFALPNAGTKIDALPGKLNQIFFNFLKLGLSLGQCSELCGFSHGFMPITSSILGVKDYLNYIDLGFYKKDEMIDLVSDYNNININF